MGEIVVSRREFLKKSGQAALAVGGGLSLEGLLGSCATISPKETREEVINQGWEANAVIPIPKDGCYVGGHRLGVSQTTVEIYANHIGKTPAFWDFSIGKYAAVNDKFPKAWCENLIVLGIVPEIKYGIIPFQGFEHIAKGKHDEDIEKFAESATGFGKPYLFVPFKEVNIKAGIPFKEVHIKAEIYWPHAGQPAGWFKEAWRHMHDIFERKGANANTIWALNYLGTCSPAGVRKNLESFFPGEDVVDWVGFTVVNRVMLGQPYTHFRYLFSPDYSWARHNHPTKPLALFEMAQSNNRNQPKWIRKAYGDVKERFPAIKMVQWWDSPAPVGGRFDNQRFSSNIKSIEAMQEVHGDSYFIGAPLPFLDKFRRR